MNKVVDLKNYRTESLNRKYFSGWRKRFNYTFTVSTRLGDIPDPILYRLAHPGDDSSYAFYELIMSVLDLGPVTKFGYLDDDDKMRVVDIHLFMADHIRFELMLRLGWLTRYRNQNEILTDLVHFSCETEKYNQHQTPELSATHPQYETFTRLIPREKDALVRRLLPHALDAFKKRLQ